MNRAAAMQAMDAAAASGLFARQRCRACGAGQYPPAELCRVCLADALEWTTVESATGELLAATTVQHSFEPSTPLPQRVGLVALGPGVTALCFLDAATQPGPVTVRATLDSTGRAVLNATPC